MCPGIPEAVVSGRLPGARFPADGAYRVVRRSGNVGGHGRVKTRQIIDQRAQVAKFFVLQMLAVFDSLQAFVQEFTGNHVLLLIRLIGGHGSLLMIYQQQVNQIIDLRSLVVVQCANGVGNTVANIKKMTSPTA